MCEHLSLCEGQWVKLRNAIRFHSGRNYIQEGNPAVVLDIRCGERGFDGDVLIRVAQVRGRKAFDLSVRRSEVEPLDSIPDGVQPSPGDLPGGFRAADVVYASHDVAPSGDVQGASRFLICRGDVGHVFGLGMTPEAREQGALAVRFEVRLDCLEPVWVNAMPSSLLLAPPPCKGQEVCLKAAIQFPDGAQVEAGSIGTMVEAVVPDGRDVVEIKIGTEDKLRLFQAQAQTLEIAEQPAVVDEGTKSRRLLELERLAQRNDELGQSLRNVSMLEQNLWALHGWSNGIGIGLVGPPGRSERRLTLMGERRCILLSQVSRKGLDGTLQNEAEIGFNHEALINDKARVGPYASAIKRAAPQKKVLDIGTGPACLLARLSLRAGAHSADAVESAERSVKMATDTLHAEANGLDAADNGTLKNISIVPDWASLAVIEVITQQTHGGPNTVAKIVGERGAAEERGRSQELRLFHGLSSDSRLALQGRYSLLVHEILGDMAGSEGAASVIADIRRRGLLADGCLCVPRSSSTMLAPTERLELSLMEKLTHRWGHGGSVDIEPCKRYSAKNFSSETLLAKPQAFEFLDFTAAAGPDLMQRRSLEFRTERDGTFDGIHMHLLVDLDGIEAIDTLQQHSSRADDIRCTWDTIYIRLLDQPIHLPAGSRIFCQCCANLEDALARYSLKTFVGELDHEQHVASVEWEGG